VSELSETREPKHFHFPERPLSVERGETRGLRRWLREFGDGPIQTERIRRIVEKINRIPLSLHREPRIREELTEAYLHLLDEDEEEGETYAARIGRRLEQLQEGEPRPRLRAREKDKEIGGRVQETVTPFDIDQWRGGVNRSLGLTEEGRELPGERPVNIEELGRRLSEIEEEISTGRRPEEVRPQLREAREWAIGQAYGHTAEKLRRDLGEIDPSLWISEYRKAREILPAFDTEEWQDVERLVTIWGQYVGGLAFRPETPKGDFPVDFVPRVLERIKRVQGDHDNRPGVLDQILDGRINPVEELPQNFTLEEKEAAIIDQVIGARPVRDRFESNQEYQRAFRAWSRNHKGMWKARDFVDYVKRDEPTIPQELLTPGFTLKAIERDEDGRVVDITGGDYLESNCSRGVRANVEFVREVDGEIVANWDILKNPNIDFRTLGARPLQAVYADLRDMKEAADALLEKVLKNPEQLKAVTATGYIINILETTLGHITEKARREEIERGPATLIGDRQVYEVFKDLFETGQNIVRAIEEKAIPNYYLYFPIKERLNLDFTQPLNVSVAGFLMRRDVGRGNLSEEQWFAQHRRFILENLGIDVGPNGRLDWSGYTEYRTRRNRLIGLSNGDLARELGLASLGEARTMRQILEGLKKRDPVERVKKRLRIDALIYYIRRIDEDLGVRRELSLKARMEFERKWLDEVIIDDPDSREARLLRRLMLVQITRRDSERQVEAWKRELEEEEREVAGGGEEDEQGGGEAGPRPENERRGLLRMVGDLFRREEGQFLLTPAEAFLRGVDVLRRAWRASEIWRTAVARWFRDRADDIWFNPTNFSPFRFFARTPLVGALAQEWLFPFRTRTFFAWGMERVLMGWLQRESFLGVDNFFNHQFWIPDYIPAALAKIPTNFPLIGWGGHLGRAIDTALLTGDWIPYTGALIVGFWLHNKILNIVADRVAEFLHNRVPGAAGPGARYPDIYKETRTP
jgi:hypothetical protein